MDTNLFGSKELFNKHGFVLLKNILSEEDSEFIKKKINEMENWEEKPNKWMIYYEKNKDERFKSRIENFVNYDLDLKNFLVTKIYPLLKFITKKDCNLFKDKLNWKNGGGKGFLSHQDHPAWIDFKPDIFYSIALFGDDCTKENGCLQFSKNHSENIIFDYDINGTGKLKNDDKYDWEFITSTPKDILLFNSYVPHRSFENKTKNPRRIFYFTYNSNEYGDLYSSYLRKKRIEFPPDIERDINKTYNTTNNKYNLANPII